MPILKKDLENIIAVILYWIRSK